MNDDDNGHDNESVYGHRDFNYDNNYDENNVKCLR